MIKRIGSFFKLVVILLVLAMISSIGYSFYSNTRYPLSYSTTIKKNADEFDVDPYLIAAVISVESGFDKDAVSNKDARGLMQIGVSTGEWAADKLGIVDYNPDMLFDPSINIRMGTWYLNNLSTEFDSNLPVVLAAYNGGSGNVSKWLRDPNYSSDGKTLDHIPFEETRNYVDKVLSRKEEYETKHKHAFDNPEDDENPILAFINKIKKIVKDMI